MTEPMSLSEKAGYPEGRAVLREALITQRHRFVDMLAALPAEGWGQASRCAGWSVHDVARHVRDGALMHVALLAGRQLPYNSERFDPRRTPDEWLARTKGAAPAETLNDLRRLAGEEAELLVTAGGDRLWTGALRRKQHPSTWSTHVFWDAWIHEADVAAPLGLPVRRSRLDLQVAVLYGLLVAAEPAARTGDYVNTVVRLDGSPSEAYRIAHDADHDDIIVTALPGADAALHGEVFAVLDSLCGRGPTLEKVLDGAASVTRRLSLLRAVAT
ncbi:maleylpyruvate isomerase family mycothiol-dependent enzyme [Micromonospora zamorensis]|uniref:maleylpyruvate isomerase family mycothiol-dependent enzyme n=1 Tax=Micromonospora zamorensis TaxID=709883 RepID=UPI003CEED3B7